MRPEIGTVSKTMVCVCRNAPLVYGLYGWYCGFGPGPHRFARLVDVDRYPEPERINQTMRVDHGPGCWAKRGHHNCAVEEVRRLQLQIDQGDSQPDSEVNAVFEG